MDIPSQTTSSEEFKTLLSYVTDNPDINVTLSDFMNPLYQACENTQPAYSLSEDDLSTHLRRAWDSMLLTAAQTSHDSADQDKLVWIMKRLVAQAPLTDANQKVVEIEGSRVWTDLPLFGQQARSAWNFPADQEVDQQVKEKWINVNAFMARLTAAYWEGSKIEVKEGDVLNAGALDFSLYGIWSLRSAFEEELGKKGKTTDAQIGAAAAWVVYASTALKGLAEKKKEFQGKVAKPGTKLREKEWRGYNEKRWQAWGRELANSQDLVQDDSVRDLVRKAIELTKQ